MASFQTIVLIISVIILILCLTGVGVALYFNRYSTVFPPISSICPDNYTVSSPSSSSSTMCTYNNNNLPTGIPPSCKTITVNEPQYVGKSGLCAKYNWTQTCNATWQGVTEESADPCPIP